MKPVKGLPVMEGHRYRGVEPGEGEQERGQPM